MYFLRLFTPRSLLCSVFTFAYTPSLDYQKPLPSKSDSTAGQRPRGPEQVGGGRGKTFMQFVSCRSGRKPDQRQAGSVCTAFLIYLSTQGRVGQEGEEKRVRWSKLSWLSCGQCSLYQIPPQQSSLSLQSVMEA